MKKTDIGILLTGVVMVLMSFIYLLKHSEIHVTIPDYFTDNSMILVLLGSGLILVKKLELAGLITMGVGLSLILTRIYLPDLGTSAGGSMAFIGSGLYLIFTQNKGYRTDSKKHSGTFIG